MASGSPDEPGAESLGGNFLNLLGSRITEAGPDRVVLRTPVADHLLQPYGIVHGGVYSSLVESAASLGGALWCAGWATPVGMDNHTYFLHAVRGGELTATATPVHRGRTVQLWQVEVANETGREVARGLVRLANLAHGDRLARPA
jgi:1,4-dihydroxy-2-naphthoyl-CoA hydrolase